MWSNIKALLLFLGLGGGKLSLLKTKDASWDDCKVLEALNKRYTELDELQHVYGLLAGKQIVPTTTIEKNLILLSQEIKQLSEVIFSKGPCYWSPEEGFLVPYSFLNECKKLNHDKSDKPALRPGVWVKVG